MSFTRISEIGETGLIERLAAIVRPTEAFATGITKGIGDDCAVLKISDGKVQVATTDLLIENIHFDLLTAPMRHLGAKALSSNVSDVCAMNATPLYALVSIGLSGKISVEMAEEFYRGLADAAKKYGVAIIGGDTSASTSGFVISVTVIGETKEPRITYRSGAKAGDLICITGDLGGAFAGLKILMRERGLMLENQQPDGSIDTSAYTPDFGDYTAAVERHLLPKARLDIVRLLESKGVVPTSMIDISDGLSSELKHLCKASDVGAVIEENLIPVSGEVRAVAAEFEDDGINYALFGGEDYELLFTLAPADAEKLFSGGNVDVKVIGKITAADAGIKLIDVYGQEFNLTEQAGFDHFEPKSSAGATDDAAGELDEDGEDLWGNAEESEMD
ncbi:MAG: thiamine-phosphate kinase [Rhizobacter sp.]|nr:thiamine-phosphate kinase [Chlorobiales bacterium]